jgi:hypothetical protein
MLMKKSAPQSFASFTLAAREEALLFPRISSGLFLERRVW